MGQPGSGERLGGEERVAEGISVRRGRGKRSLRIAFMFRGVECREPIKLEPTAPNIRYAVRLRGEILNVIERGSFNYADYFPDSPRAQRFGFAPTGKTVGDLLDEWEVTWAATLEASTWLGYKKVIDRHLRPWWGAVRMRDLTPGEIRARILSVEGIALKTARNVLSPLNIMLDQAFADGELAANPMARVKLKAFWPKDQRTTGWEADPFSFEEMTAIFGVCGEEEADYWRTAFGTGLRPSEQIELRWARVDLEGLAVRIEVARVTGIDGAALKGPKTEAGKRVVSLTRGAHEALQRQQERTGTDGAHVFLDARYGLPWQDEAVLRKRWWRTLKKADVRYRNPYQTRHTFASALLAAGRPPLWVAQQMGHRTVEMVQRHYGRWIEQGQDPATRAALAAFFSHPSPKSGKILAFSL